MWKGATQKMVQRIKIMLPKQCPGNTVKDDTGKCSCPDNTVDDGTGTHNCIRCGGTGLNGCTTEVAGFCDSGTCICHSGYFGTFCEGCYLK